ncbi:MAG TPA: tripartite tricarboxylate transporter substrate binding protein [Usitatibacter sp.]
MKTTLAALAVGFTLAIMGAGASDLPSKPIRIIVPSTAGGGIDLLARLVGERLSRSLGQPVAIENIPGGETSIGMNAVAAAPKDGATLGMATPVFITAAERAYDPMKDFVPVALIGSTPLVLAVNPSTPARNVREFIEFARTKPGMLNFASLGPATTQGLAAALFNRMAGVEAVEIPYKGSAPGVMDLLAGNVQYIFNGLPSMLPHLASGKLRALAVTSASRSPLLPDVPSIGETLPGYEVTTWYALVAPAGIPAAALNRLNREIGAIVDDPEVKARLRDQGVEARAMKPDEVARFFASENRKWAKLASESRAAAR